MFYLSKVLSYLNYYFNINLNFSIFFVSLERTIINPNFTMKNQIKGYENKKY